MAIKATAPTAKAATSKGYSTSMTTAQVKAVQKAAGITQDGIYGKNTAAAVSKVTSGMGGGSSSTKTTSGGGGSSSGGGGSSSKAPAPVTTSGTLVKGSSGSAVTALQNQLINAGYLPKGAADGKFGPQTEAAVISFQQSNGLAVDGKAGTNTKSALNTSTGTKTDSRSMWTATGDFNPDFIPTTPEENAAVAKIQREEAVKDSVWAGNSPAALEYAVSTGDFSGLLNDVGQPFSDAEQAAALKESEAALAPGYEIAKQKEMADTEQALADQQRAFGEYQDTQGLLFEEDKSAADQSAADTGVLFSGSRVQKEQSLANKYTKDMESKRADVGSNISTLGRGFQSKYGDTASQGLSNYYKLGQSSYNPKVATGGSSKGGLSSVYNPAGLGYQGTAYVSNKADINKRAANLLWNKGNKLLSTGINNQK